MDGINRGGSGLRLPEGGRRGHLFYLFTGIALFLSVTGSVLAGCDYSLQPGDGFTRIRVGTDSSGDGWMDMDRLQLLHSNQFKSTPLLLEYPGASHSQVITLCEELQAKGFQQITFHMKKESARLDAYSMLALLGGDREVTVVTSSRELREFIASLSIEQKRIQVISPEKISGTSAGKLPSGVIVVDPELSARIAGWERSSPKGGQSWMIAPAVSELRQELAIQQLVDARRKFSQGNTRCDQ